VSIYNHNTGKKWSPYLKYLSTDGVDGSATKHYIVSRGDKKPCYIIPSIIIERKRLFDTRHNGNPFAVTLTQKKVQAQCINIMYWIKDTKHPQKKLFGLALTGFHATVYEVSWAQRKIHFETLFEEHFSEMTKAEQLRVVMDYVQDQLNEK